MMNPSLPMTILDNEFPRSCAPRENEEHADAPIFFPLPTCPVYSRRPRGNLQEKPQRS